MKNIIAMLIVIAAVFHCVYATSAPSVDPKLLKAQEYADKYNVCFRCTSCLHLPPQIRESTNEKPSWQAPIEYSNQDNFEHLFEGLRTGTCLGLYESLLLYQELSGMEERSLSN